eukprot:gene18952-25526_t
MHIAKLTNSRACFFHRLAWPVASFPSRDKPRDVPRAFYCCFSSAVEKRCTKLRHGRAYSSVDIATGSTEKSRGNICARVEISVPAWKYLCPRRNICALVQTFSTLREKIVRNVKDFFNISSNGPIDGGGDACMHPASQDEIAFSPQEKECMMTHQSAPISSLPANTQVVEKYTYPLSALQSQPPVQSLIDQQMAHQVMAQQQATQQHMAQDQKDQQQMTLRQLAQHQSVQRQMPQPFSDSVAQPFLVCNPTDECFPPMMPPPSPATSEPLPQVDEASRHLRRGQSNHALGNGKSEPLLNMLGKQSLKNSISLDQFVCVPNVKVTTARLNSGTSALAISSVHANSRQRLGFPAEPMSNLSMPMPHPSLKASVAEDLAMGGFTELDFEEEATQHFCSAMLRPSLHSWDLPLRTLCV